MKLGSLLWNKWNKSKLLIMEISCLFVNNNLLFIEDSEYSGTSNRIIIKNCNFHQTPYGSVIVSRPTHSTIEYYPSQISHIIFRK